jgi:hypothetical protein
MNLFSCSSIFESGCPLPCFIYILSTDMLVSLFVGDSLGMPLSIIVYNYNNHLSENTKETKFTCIKIIQIVEVIKDKSSKFDHLLTLIGFISNLNLAI